MALTFGKKSSVDPRRVYDSLFTGTQAQTPAFDPVAQLNTTIASTTPSLPSTLGAGVGDPGGGTPGYMPGDPAWAKFLSLIGAGSTGNPEAAADWLGQAGKYWRQRQRGFDLFGLVPQEIYWQNLQGSGAENLTNNTMITPTSWWSGYQTPGSWGGSGNYYGDWLKQNLDLLQKAWGGLSAQEHQTWRNRLLSGTGLPAYLQAFLKARPQWITDYISKTFT